MARAKTVWVVLGSFDDGPVSVFTVKHELVAWLKAHPAWPSLHVKVFPDGGGESRKHIIDVSELWK